MDCRAREEETGCKSQGCEGRSSERRRVHGTARSEADLPPFLPTFNPPLCTTSKPRTAACQWLHSPTSFELRRTPLSKA